MCANMGSVDQMGQSIHLKNKSVIFKCFVLDRFKPERGEKNGDSFIFDLSEFLI